MLSKEHFNKNQIFHDKNGIQIKEGNKIKSNIDDQFRDCIVHKRHEKLGLYFKHADYFILFEDMLDRFFDTIEVIND